MNLIKNLNFSYNNKVYKIESMDWDTRPTDRFEMKDKKTKELKNVSFIEYYSTILQRQIKDVKQPLLNCVQVFKKPGFGQPERVPKMVKLIPEFCFIIGILAHNCE